ncbi:MAG: hypothetical protein OXI24_11255 [Candidatus Poribacteria bacterium]|nr:hypothetical protein [Candidatus Poribacteria bacterium]
MKKIITSLLLGLLFAITLPLIFAQQSQITQKSNSEVDTLKRRVSELESKLQTVENVEKMELIVKLANVEFSKFERELRDSNDGWLMKWNTFFLGVLAVIGVALWFSVKLLIANKVEENLDEFKEALSEVGALKNEIKEAVGQVNILADQVRILKKEQAISVLGSLVNLYDPKEQDDYEETSPIQSETLLDVFVDKTRNLGLRYKAGEVLSAREIPQFASPLLEFLDSVINSEFDWKDILHTESRLLNFVKFLGYIHTQEAYKGLTSFLDRLLLTEDVELKELLLTQTVFSLAEVSIGLEKGDSVSILKSAAPQLRDPDHNLGVLAGYFDKLNAPEGIKEILTNGLTDEMPDVETRCLVLLQKHDPEFVEKWKAQKESNNTQTEES